MRELGSSRLAQAIGAVVLTVSMIVAAGCKSACTPPLGEPDGVWVASWWLVPPGSPAGVRRRHVQPGAAGRVFEERVIVSVDVRAAAAPSQLWVWRSFVIVAEQPGGATLVGWRASPVGTMLTSGGISYWSGPLALYSEMWTREETESGGSVPVMYVESGASRTVTRGAATSEWFEYVRHDDVLSDYECPEWHP